MRTVETPKVPRVDEAKVAQVLSDPYALRVLSVCMRKAKPVKSIELETELPQATVYRQVHRLVEDGLLAVERSALTEDGKRYELYRSRIQRAKLEVDASGVRMTWELVEEMEERLARVWNSLRGA